MAWQTLGFWSIRVKVPKKEHHAIFVRPMKIDDLTQLGSIIKERRQLAGMTLGQAAEFLGVGRRFLIELEKGSRRANVETVIHVLKMYGLDLEVCLPRTIPQQKPPSRQAMQVFAGSTEIGSLGVGGDGLEFKYCEEVLGDDSVPSLSISLPKRAGSFKGTECSYFENLLPEGDERNRLAQEMNLLPGDIHGLLGTALDCPGIVSIVPKGRGGPTPTYRSLSVKKIARLIETSDGSFARYQVDSGFVLSGTRPKLALIKGDHGWLLPENGSPSTHFLKGPAGSLAQLDIVENEYFCMQLADRIDLPVAEVKFLRLPAPVLLVTRFDRDTTSGGEIRKLHQEDFAQATATAPGIKWESAGGPGFATIANILRAESSLPIRDLMVLARWLVFNYLIGNHNGHCKNISLLYRPDGIGLAPFYGLLSTTVMAGQYPDEIMSLGGDFNSHFVRKARWVAVGEELGLPEKAILRIVEEVMESTGAALDVVVAETAAICGDNPVFQSIADGIRQRNTALAEAQ